MIKRICDICGKEIDSIDAVYTIKIFDTSDAYETVVYEDVCINCRNDIKNRIYKLKLNKEGE